MELLLLVLVEVEEQQMEEVLEQQMEEVFYHLLLMVQVEVLLRLFDVHHTEEGNHTHSQKCPPSLPNMIVGQVIHPHALLHLDC